jgi:hypothetical protein
MKKCRRKRNKFKRKYEEKEEEYGNSRDNENVYISFFLSFSCRGTENQQELNCCEWQNRSVCLFVCLFESNNIIKRDEKKRNI